MAIITECKNKINKLRGFDHIQVKRYLVDRCMTKLNNVKENSHID